MRRLQMLESRRIDSTLDVRASLAGEVYKRMRESESVRYTVGAMQPIDPEYTRNTEKQGQRVQNQLDGRLPGKHDFRFQGSTVTDTHIKARSDIDLLVIQTRWFRLEPPQIPANRYLGDPVVDMRALRNDSADALEGAFPQAEVDSSNSTAIKISGGSLSREVDVVPASWYDTLRYSETKDELFRGVEVFDNDAATFTVNTPFLHHRRVQLCDEETRGGFRRATRLMKSLRYDSEGRCDISSYNIMGIAFNIPADRLMPAVGRELVILENCYEYCLQLQQDAALRASIRVPDNHRTVFGDRPGASLAQLTSLTKELYDLRQDVLNENVRSFHRLAEARVEYAHS